MLSKKQIIELYYQKQRHKPTDWDIALSKTVSRWCDVIWRNKITEFKLAVKEADKLDFGLKYKQVWDIIEKELIEEKK